MTNSINELRVEEQEEVITEIVFETLVDAPKVKRGARFDKYTPFCEYPKKYNVAEHYFSRSEDEFA